MSTEKPWFWAVISTLRVARSITGRLEPWLPNLSFMVRLQGQSQQLVAQADTEDWNLADHLPYVVDHFCHGLGIAGALERKMPSGFMAMASSAGKVAGTTVMSHPAEARQRRMLYLMPKS